MRTETLTSLVDTASTDDLLKLSNRWWRRCCRWSKKTGDDRIKYIHLIFGLTYEARMYRLNGHIDTALSREKSVDRLIDIVCTEKGA